MAMDRLSAVNGDATDEMDEPDDTDVFCVNKRECGDE